MWLHAALRGRASRESILRRGLAAPPENEKAPRGAFSFSRRVWLRMRTLFDQRSAEGASWRGAHEVGDSSIAERSTRQRRRRKSIPAAQPQLRARSAHLTLSARTTKWGHSAFLGNAECPHFVSKRKSLLKLKRTDFWDTSHTKYVPLSYTA